MNWQPVEMPAGWCACTEPAFSRCACGELWCSQCLWRHSSAPGGRCPTVVRLEREMKRQPDIQGDAK